MMLMMCVMVVVRTGPRAALSTPWLTWMTATSLTQNHVPPEIAC